VRKRKRRSPTMAECFSRTCTRFPATLLQHHHHPLPTARPLHRHPTPCARLYCSSFFPFLVACRRVRGGKELNHLSITSPSPRPRSPGGIIVWRSIPSLPRCGRVSGFGHTLSLSLSLSLACCASRRELRSEFSSGCSPVCFSRICAHGNAETLSSTGRTQAEADGLADRRT